MAAAVLAAIGIAIAIAAIVRSGTRPPVRSDTRSTLDLAAHTKAAASRTAIGVLQEVRLPVGSEPMTFAEIGSQRAADLDFYAVQNARWNRLLDFYGIQEDGIAYSARFWRVPEGINEAASYFERDAPPGLLQEETPGVDLAPNATGFYLGNVIDASLPFSPYCRPKPSFTRLTFNLLMSPATPKVTDVLVAVEVYWRPRVCVKF
ncbi:MAG: hypothetical protein ABSB55_04115 [Acidimicrobiales bacterium]